MMNVDTSDRKQQRNFGVVMAVAISVLGLIRWASHRHGAPVGFFYVAAAFLISGIVAPRVLRPVLAAWLKFSLALNWVMTRVLLTVAFCVLIIPTRVILRLAGKDPLNRAWDPDAASYWEPAEEQPAELERYLNQF